MADTSSLHHELAALQAELGKPSGSGSGQRSDCAEREVKSDAPDAASPLAADLEEPFRELNEALSAHMGSVEDFIAARPLASVLGAFVLGLALGRMTGRG